MEFDGDANLRATELRLGLPGTSDKPSKPSPSKGNKRAIPEMAGRLRSERPETGTSGDEDRGTAAPPAKAQIVGWPPVRSYRRNNLQPKQPDTEASGTFVKVSMDGAPYLRKIDLKQSKSYPELLGTLEKLFNFSIGDYSEGECYNGSEYAPTYEDKDGDWMLIGDVPWNMFISSCKRLRIMRGQEAQGLPCL